MKKQLKVVAWATMWTAATCYATARFAVGALGIGAHLIYVRYRDNNL